MTPTYQTFIFFSITSKFVSFKAKYFATPDAKHYPTYTHKRSRSRFSSSSLKEILLSLKVKKKKTPWLFILFSLFFNSKEKMVFSRFLFSLLPFPITSSVWERKHKWGKMGWKKGNEEKKNKNLLKTLKDF